MENDIIASLIKNGGIVAGITVVYFIIKLFMNGKNKKNDDKKIDDLYDWHKPDSAGIQQWKNSNLAKEIENLAESIDRQSELHTKHTTEQTKVMQSMCALLDSNTSKIDLIYSKVE